MGYNETTALIIFVCVSDYLRKKNTKLVWQLCFSRVFYLLLCPFSLQFTAFWSRKLLLQRNCNTLEFSN